MILLDFVFKPAAADGLVVLLLGSTKGGAGSTPGTLHTALSLFAWCFLHKKPILTTPQCSRSPDVFLQSWKH